MMVKHCSATMTTTTPGTSEAVKSPTVFNRASKQWENHWRTLMFSCQMNSFWCSSFSMLLNKGIPSASFTDSIPTWCSSQYDLARPTEVLKQESKLSVLPLSKDAGSRKNMDTNDRLIPTQALHPSTASLSNWQISGLIILRLPTFSQQYSLTWGVCVYDKYFERILNTHWPSDSCCWSVVGKGSKEKSKTFDEELTSTSANVPSSLRTLTSATATSFSPDLMCAIGQVLTSALAGSSCLSCGSLGETCLGFPPPSLASSEDSELLVRLLAASLIWWDVLKQISVRSTTFSGWAFSLRLGPGLPVRGPSRLMLFSIFLQFFASLPSCSSILFCSLSFSLMSSFKFRLSVADKQPPFNLEICSLFSFSSSVLACCNSCWSSSAPSLYFLSKSLLRLGYIANKSTPICLAMTVNRLSSTHFLFISAFMTAGFLVCFTTSSASSLQKRM